MVFAFHAMEAYLNYVGARLAPEIWVNEREYFKQSGFTGKLRKVMDRAGLPWVPGKRPLQTLVQLKNLRDTIAHGKPERKAGTQRHPHDTEAPHVVFTLRSMYTPKGKMERAVQDVERLGNEIQLHAKLKVDDPWFGEEAFQRPLSYSFGATTLEE